MARGAGKTLAGRRLAPLHIGSLAGAALRTVGAGMPGLWLLALIWFAANTAMIALVHVLYPQLQALGPWAKAASGAGQGIVHGLGAAVAMRSYLGEPQRPWRFDARVLGFVAIVASLAALQTGLPAAVSSLLGGAASQTPVARAVLGFGAVLLALWTAARTALWSIGVLIGDRRLSFTFGWRAMGGAVLAYLSAYALLVGPAYVANVAAASWYYQTGALLPLGLVGASYTTVGFLTAGLHTEAYRQRLGPSDETLAEVFA